LLTPDPVPVLKSVSFCSGKKSNFEASPTAWDLTFGMFGGLLLALIR
jgi:hypothetical protein